MKNKVLIRLFVPENDNYYDIFIPVNEFVWKIKKMIIRCINDLNGALNQNKEYVLINKNTNIIYQNNEIIIESDIRNATELILISKKY